MNLSNFFFHWVLWITFYCSSACLTLTFSPTFFMLYTKVQKKQFFFSGRVYTSLSIPCTCAQLSQFCFPLLFLFLFDLLSLSQASFFSQQQQHLHHLCYFEKQKLSLTFVVSFIHSRNRLRVSTAFFLWIFECGYSLLPIPLPITPLILWSFILLWLEFDKNRFILD